MNLDKILRWLLNPVVDIFKVEADNSTVNGPYWELLNNDFSKPGNQQYVARAVSNTKYKKSAQFRPKNFNEYIGQRYAKQILATYIQGIKERKIVFPHTLIHGNPGMGKTTLAKIMANALNVKFVETIASEIETADEMIEKIVACNGGIVFLDEIHSMPLKVMEKLYPMVEDFTFDGNPLPPFTLIGATTEVGEIIKRAKPFYDRFKLIIELEEYIKGDLVRIGSQYKTNTFPKEIVGRDTLEIIADNSRGTPRTVIRLVEATIYFKKVANVLRSFRIIKDGYTQKDLKVLKYMTKNEKGVGLQGLAAYMATSSETYMYEIEPFLLQRGLIIRTARGRKITDEGRKVIVELENRMKEVNVNETGTGTNTV